MELLGSAFAKDAARSFDFRAFYAAGHLVRSSASHLYDLHAQEQAQNAFVSPAQRVIPFYHPSFEALLYLPLSWLSYSRAYVVYIAVNALFLGFAFLVGPRHSLFPLAGRAPALTFFVFLPVLMTILVGQDSILFLLICCFVLRELHKGDDLSAGAILALGLFRPQLAVPLALLLACRYGWKFLAGFGMVMAPITLISALIVQREGLAALVAMLGKASLVTNHGDAAQRAMAVFPQRMPNLYGLLYVCCARHLTSGALFDLTMAVSMGVFFGCAYLLRRTRGVSTTFAIAVLGAILLSYHLYAYDATLLLLPILLLGGRLHAYLVLVCYVLPFVLFFSSIPDWFALMAPVPIALLYVAGLHVLKTNRA
jgi:hypothetical protein